MKFSWLIYKKNDVQEIGENPPASTHACTERIEALNLEYGGGKDDCMLSHSEFPRKIELRRIELIIHCCLNNKKFTNPRMENI